MGTLLTATCGGPIRNNTTQAYTAHPIFNAALLAKSIILGLKKRYIKQMFIVLVM
jgi:hypothetical protein